MHSNFITPPDFVESVLIYNATETQIQQLSEIVKNLNKSYNVYFYSDTMNDPEWCARIVKIADKIIYAENTDPGEYFAK
jgi:5'(3')-deoxyribonucleotidase